MASEEDVAGNGLVWGASLQAVAAGQIQKRHLLAVAAMEDAFLLFNGHTGIISHLLPHASEGIEKGAFTRVRVAGDGDASGLRRFDGQFGDGVLGS